MKPIHILLLLLSFPALVAAQLEGRYESDERWETTITLNTDSSFNFESPAYKLTGRGVYHLSKDKLILTFDEDTLNEPKVKVKIDATSKRLDTDSITITVTTGVLYNINSVKYEIKESQTLTFTDASGNTVLKSDGYPAVDPWIIKLPRSRNKLTGVITASRGFYYDADFKITPDHNYSIDIKLKERHELHDLEYVYAIKYVDGAIDNNVVYLKRSDKEDFAKFIRK